MDAAGVVADHAAQGAAVVGGRIGGEGQVILFSRVAEMVEDDSGLDAGDAALGIDLENLRHVLRKIEDDGDVAELSGKRGSGAAAKKRSAELAARGDRHENVVGIAREDDSDGYLAVVRSVGRIESAAAVVEADISPHFRAESISQPRSITER